MLIALGFLFLAWFGVFVFLWGWALEHIDGWWGGLLPVGWFILAPLTVAQICIWFS